MVNSTKQRYQVRAREVGVSWHQRGAAVGATGLKERSGWQTPATPNYFIVS